MGEHLLCKQGVRGSNPLASTKFAQPPQPLPSTQVELMVGAILLLVHIAAGSIALLTAVVAIVTAKGGRYHVLVGRIYAIAMTVIFITALPLTILGSSVFLLLIAVFSFYLVGLLSCKPLSQMHRALSYRFNPLLHSSFRWIGA